MEKDIVLFRGYNEGVNIEISSSNYDEILKNLDEKLRGNINFYQGAKILSILAPKLKVKEIIEINYILKYKYKLLVHESIIDNLTKNINYDIIEKEDEIEDFKKDSMETDSTKFVNRTIRSGQIIEYDGSIVIIGDVNPGAILRATGNIIILGTFRGVAQAGINGNNNSFVAAYRLEPSQLRISDKIARAPDKQVYDESINLPEIAKIVKDELIIEPYLPNK